MIKNNERDYISSLDGLRSIAIIMVAWFHFWQQSWLTPYISFNNSVTRCFGITTIELASFVRYGYYFVDLLILISAVVNFLPYAKAIVGNTPLPSTKEFYIKRASRILPSYYLAIVIMLIATLVTKGFGYTHIWKDVLTHITCTSIFFKDTYLTPDINPVLWTVQLEIIYYLIIPFIARAVKKAPFATVAILYLIGLFSSNFIAYRFTDYAFLSNNILTFAGYYASGIVITLIYCSMKENIKHNVYVSIAGILLMAVSYLYFRKLLLETGSVIQFYQLTVRFPMTIALSGFVLGTVFAEPLLKYFLGNRVFREFAMISYNFYIWHQTIAVQLKLHHFPSWKGMTDQEILSNRPWQIKYTIVIILASLLAATVLTYFWEKPVSDLIRKRFLRKEPLTSPTDSTT